jgi:hypothetical protein
MEQRLLDGRSHCSVLCLRLGGWIQGVDSENATWEYVLIDDVTTNSMCDLHLNFDKDNLSGALTAYICRGFRRGKTSYSCTPFCLALHTFSNLTGSGLLVYGKGLAWRSGLCMQDARCLCALGLGVTGMVAAEAVSARCTLFHASGTCALELSVSGTVIPISYSTPYPHNVSKFSLLPSVNKNLNGNNLHHNFQIHFSVPPYQVTRFDMDNEEGPDPNQLVEAEIKEAFQNYLSQESWGSSISERFVHDKFSAANSEKQSEKHPRRQVLLQSSNGSIVLGYHNENSDLVWAQSGRG